MQQILCFEIVQSKVQLSNRKVALEVEEHITRELWPDGMGGWRSMKRQNEIIKQMIIAMATLVETVNY